MLKLAPVLPGAATRSRIASRHGQIWRITAGRISTMLGRIGAHRRSRIRLAHRGWVAADHAHEDAALREGGDVQLSDSTLGRVKQKLYRVGPNFGPTLGL